MDNAEAFKFITNRSAFSERIAPSDEIKQQWREYFGYREQKDKVLDSFPLYIRHIDVDFAEMDRQITARVRMGNPADGPGKGFGWNVNRGYTSFQKRRPLEDGQWGLSMGSRSRLQGGVLHGDPLSPTLFNQKIDYVLVFLNQYLGVNIHSNLVSELAYADDLILVASSREGNKDTITDTMISTDAHVTHLQQ
ncbi:Very-long-chain (3R)-3-hydroxyacyl-CoA dehydratase 3 [Armadillidium vulgare]|nr:Very-long-chain (3R)-3-hydroxyacyl-CoA dehydratase 3 [Armadillidium vulgare]